MEKTPQGCATRAKEAHGIYLPIPVVIYGWMTAPRGQKSLQWACQMYSLSKLQWMETAVWQRDTGAYSKMSLAQEWVTDSIHDGTIIP